MESESQTWLFEHCKEAYQYQLKRTDDLRDRLSKLATLLTLLGSGITYAWINFKSTAPWNENLWFYVPACISLGLFLVAIFRLLYTLGWGFKYAYIPVTKEIVELAEKLQSHKTLHDPDLDVLSDLRTELLSRYSSGADHNLGVNQRRGNNVLRSTQIAIIAFLFILICLPHFYSERSSSKQNPISVTIETPIIIKNMTTENRTPSEGSPPPTASPGSTPPPASPAPAPSVDATPQKPILGPNTYMTEASQRMGQSCHTKETRQEKTD